MPPKMSYSLNDRRIQCTERIKEEKSGWVNGPELEFLFYQGEVLKLGFISQLPVEYV